MIRPEVAAGLRRWREVIVAVGVCAAGLWIATRGGWLLGPLGGIVTLAGLMLAWQGWRRTRFAAAADAPGVVEVDEGQIGWFGPGIGGFVAVRDLTEIGLVTVAGLRCWRLRQSDGQMLLVPVGAEGVARLFDALTALPGLDASALLAALEGGVDRPLIWRRSRPLALT